MIGLTINNVIVPVNTKKGIEIKKENPDFLTDFIKNDISVPFDLDITSETIIATGFVSKLSTWPKNKIIDDVIMHLNGRNILGKLIVNDISKTKINTTFVVNGFALELLNTKLTDVDYGTLQLGTNSEEVGIFCYLENSKTYPDSNLCFPTVRWDDFYKGKNPDYLQRSNFRDNAKGWLWYNRVKSTSELIPENKYNITPAIYLFFLLEKALEQFGYTADGKFMDDAEIKTSVYASNKAIDKFRDQIHVDASGFVMFFDDDFSDTFYFDDSDGNWNGSEYTVTAMSIVQFNIAIEIKNRTNTDGFIKVTLYLNGSPTTHTATFNTSTDTVLLMETLPSPQHNPGDVLTFVLTFDQPVEFDVYTAQLEIDHNSKDIQVGLSPDNLNIYETELNYSEHLPDMSVNEFIAQLKLLFNLSVIFNETEKKLHLNFVKERYNQNKHTDITNKVISDINFTIIDPSKGFTFGFDYNEKDLLEMQSVSLELSEIHDVNIKEIILKEGENYIIPQFVPVTLYGPDPFLMVAKMNDDTISEPFKIDGQKSRRIGFYRGMQPIRTGGDPYPLLTPYNKDANGAIIGNYSFKINDSVYGTYEIFWRKHLEFILSIIEECEFFMEKSDLTTDEIIKIEENIFHIKEIIDSYNADAIITKITSYKINPL